jgi:hypothetical protein
MHAALRKTVIAAMAIVSIVGASVALPGTAEARWGHGGGHWRGGGWGWGGVGLGIGTGRPAPRPLLRRLCLWRRLRHAAALGRKPLRPSCLSVGPHLLLSGHIETEAKSTRPGNARPFVWNAWVVAQNASYCSTGR